MWFDEAVIYQIYPLGLCGAPLENDGALVPRIRRVLDWVDHIKDLGADTVLFNPLFESDKHGYDTRDYNTLDCRLGSNEDFKAVCDALLTAAFGQLARADLPAERIVKAVECLSHAAGSAGMVGGQALDMAGEGRALTLADVEELQKLKTGALISAAAELGVIAGGLYLLLSRKVKGDAVSMGVSAVAATFLHSMMVLGLLSLLFQALPLKDVIAALIGVNCLLEMLAAAVVTAAVCVPLKKALVRR